MKTGEWLQLISTIASFVSTISTPIIAGWFALRLQSPKQVSASQEPVYPDSAQSTEVFHQEDVLGTVQSQGKTTRRRLAAAAALALIGLFFPLVQSAPLSKWGIIMIGMNAVSLSAIIGLWLLVYVLEVVILPMIQHLSVVQEKVVAILDQLTELQATEQLHTRPIATEFADEGIELQPSSNRC